jgi:hypothetical protein
MGSRERMTDSVAWSAGSAINAIGECEQRSSARYHRARLTLPAGGGWSHIAGVEITEASPDGER